MEMLYNSLPIITYHAVNDTHGFPLARFKEQMNWLAREGYRTIFIKEFLLAKGIGQKCVAITFDDGYLDAYLYAYPILKQLGLKATLAVITDRISEENGAGRIRSNYEINRDAALGKDVSSDFLSWTQLEEMLASGLVEVISHTHTHEAIHTSHEVVGFNQQRDWKHISANGGDDRSGIPLYPIASRMAGRRYIDDPALRDILAKYVAGHGGRQFFKRKGWDKDLSAVVQDYPSGGHFETEAQMKEAIRAELSVSKELIEKRLGIECDLVCWPWGQYSKEAVALARECGYQGAITLNRGANARDTDPFRLCRFEVRDKGLAWFRSRLGIYSNRKFAAPYGLFYRNYSATKTLRPEEGLRQFCVFVS